MPDSRIRDRFLKIDTENLTAAQLALRHNPSGYVVDSVPLSILSAIESESVLDSIKSIVEFGGDTDTIASMFGHLCGAIHGSDCIPMAVVKQIDEYDLISRTAADLSRVAVA